MNTPKIDIHRRYLRHHLRILLSHLIYYEEGTIQATERIKQDARTAARLLQGLKLEVKSEKERGVYKAGVGFFNSMFVSFRWLHPSSQDLINNEQRLYMVCVIESILERLDSCKPYSD